MSTPIEIMDGVSVSPDGSLTLPQEALSALGVGVGGQVALVVEGTTVRLENPVILAMKKLQRGMAGEAERLGITSDEDAMAIVKELRGDYS